MLTGRQLILTSSHFERCPKHRPLEQATTSGPAFRALSFGSFQAVCPHKTVSLSISDSASLLNQRQSSLAGKTSHAFKLGAVRRFCVLFELLKALQKRLYRCRVLRSLRRPLVLVGEVLLVQAREKTLRFAPSSRSQPLRFLSPKF